LSLGEWPHKEFYQNCQDNNGETKVVHQVKDHKLDIYNWLYYQEVEQRKCAKVPLNISSNN